MKKFSFISLLIYMQQAEKTHARIKKFLRRVTGQETENGEQGTGRIRDEFFI